MLSLWWLLVSVHPSQALELKEGDDLTELSIEALYAVKISTVFGVSKRQENVRQAPATVTIITDDEIRKHGYRTLAEALDSVRGLYMTYDRNYNYLGTRGFNRPGDLNTRFLLLVDNHRINDNVYDSAPIGTEFPLDLDLIDHVEVIQGPGSALYGSSAFFGVINVITKRGGDLQGAQASGAYGSFDTFQGRFSYGRKLTNDVEFLLSGSNSDSGGRNRIHFSEYNTVNGGIAEKVDGSDWQNLFGRISYHGLSMEAGFVSRSKRIPTGSFGTVFNDRRNETIDEHSFVDVAYEHEFGENTSLSGRLFYDHFIYHGVYIFDPLGTGIASDFNENSDYGKGDWWGFETQVSHTFMDRHRASAGFEFRDNLKQDQLNVDSNPWLLNLDDRRRTQIYSPYAQLEFELHTNLVLQAGVRYDHYDTFDGSINPRASLVYSPLMETTLKAIYGRSFRAPNNFETWYQDGGNSQKANPALQPETIDTYELTLQQGLPWHQTVNLSGFFYQIQDLITQETDQADGLLVFRNLNAIQTKGAGAEIRGEYAGGWRTRASYSFQDARDEGTGTRLSNSPRHLIKLGLTAPLYADKIFLGTDLNYTSGRNSDPLPRNSMISATTSGYWLWNATIYAVKLAKGLEVSASVYNLLDRHYFFPASAEFLQEFLEQDGRAFRVKLTYRF